MHSSLDTQEDKQAKALKEIYKLCKTDEGDQSSDYILVGDQKQIEGQPPKELQRVVEENRRNNDNAASD